MTDMGMRNCKKKRKEVAIRKCQNFFEKNMKIAIEGCCHGALNKIYQSIQDIEKKEGYKVDLLLICGYFILFMTETFKLFGIM